MEETNKWLRLIVDIIVTLIFLLASQAQAQVINACITNNGTIRVAPCGNNETPISWNVAGPQGVPGQSVVGPPGPPGAAGPQGATGSIGVAQYTCIGNQTIGQGVPILFLPGAINTDIEITTTPVIGQELYTFTLQPGLYRLQLLFGPGWNFSTPQFLGLNQGAMNVVPVVNGNNVNSPDMMGLLQVTTPNTTLVFNIVLGGGVAGSNDGQAGACELMITQLQ